MAVSDQAGPSTLRKLTMEQSRLNVQAIVGHSESNLNIRRNDDLTNGRHFFGVGHVVRVLDGRSSVEQPC